ncbi:WXG100 family type VII secretion target [Nocardia beijingensis]|uniref:WXG100 family type VII secretion target n=1 Tax=Nocardia beijingensis TaxID=95162 RepID=UPI0008357578|nr:hypothetical protein [Nocardia beijingensis]
MNALTKSQVLALRPDVLTAQADRWAQQAHELAGALDNQYRAVDKSLDSWQGESGNAMRGEYEAVQSDTGKLRKALELGADAARSGATELAAAQAAVATAVRIAEEKGYTVAEDGTCTPAASTQQTLLATVSDPDRLQTAMRALEADAEIRTAAIKEALNQADAADTAATRAITDAFADLPGSEQTPAGQPQAKPINDGYGSWSDLGENEKSVCLNNPRDCNNSRERRDKQIAQDESAKAFPGDPESTRQDAARHCIWQGLTTESANADFAKRLADAHEKDKPSPLNGSKEMDEWNNHTGRQVGLRLEGNRQAIIDTCIRYAHEAQVVDPNHMNYNNVDGTSLVVIKE